MKKYWFIFAAFMLCASTMGNAQLMRTYIPYDSEQITVSNTAIGFTTAKINPGGGSINRAALASCTAECATASACPLRYSENSAVTPTSSVGKIININTATEQAALNVYGWDTIRQFKAIRSGSNDIKLSCTYYR